MLCGIAMKRNSKKLQALLGLILLPMLSVSSAAAAEDSTFTMGQNLYNCGDYKSALNYLKACQKNLSYDPRPLYFQAACEYKLGHYQQAASLYSQVVSKFPGSDAAEMSKRALAAMGVGYAAAKSGGSLSSFGSLRTDNIPDSQSISCGVLGGKPLVQVLIGGVKIDMQVDLTRTDTVIGVNFARDHRLPDVPTVKKDGTPYAKSNSKTKTETKTEVKSEDKAEVKAADKDVSPATATGTGTGTGSTPNAGGDNTKVAAAPAAELVEPEYALYEIDLGKMKRTSFPVYLDPKNPDIAVLGNDFFEYTTASFDSKKGMLNITRNASFKDPFAAGMKFFNKGNYVQAMALFKKATLDRPADSRPLYAMAVCAQKLGKTSDATAMYRRVVKRFPNSEAQLLATSALMSIDPTFTSDGLPSLNKGKTYGPQLVDKQLAQFEVPYKAEGGNIRVTISIDGKNVDVYWGGSGTFSMTSAQLREIDPNYLDKLSDADVSEVPNENSNIIMRKAVSNVSLRTVRLGQAQANNVTCTITDYISRIGMVYAGNGLPVLGQDTFKDWHWEINPGRRVLHFMKNQ